MKRLPVIALVGRPNVGKSTIFNRLVGGSEAIVEDIPGVTRDRHYAEAEWFSHKFTVIDTGGFEPEAAEGDLFALMRFQTMLAIEESDVIIFVTDSQAGLCPQDAQIAQILRQVKTPVLLTVNKVDSDKQEMNATEFWELGFSEMECISAAHKRGFGDFTTRVIEEFEKLDFGTNINIDDEDDGEIRVAVVGRPNVGKSTLINRLLGEERLVAFDEPGTTRDTIDVDFMDGDDKFVFIDTAGVRRRHKVSKGLESYTVMRTLKALERAHVVLFVIDAVEGIQDQDLQLMSLVKSRGRSMMILYNKWDLVEKESQTSGAVVKHFREIYKEYRYAPFIFISATSGQRTHKILDQIRENFAEFNKRITTAKVNQFIEECQNIRQMGVYRGRNTKIFFATQNAVRPPQFIFTVNYVDGVPEHYQRFITNQLREKYSFSGSPIRLRFKERRRSLSKGPQGGQSSQGPQSSKSS